MTDSCYREAEAAGTRPGCSDLTSTTQALNLESTPTTCPLEVSYQEGASYTPVDTWAGDTGMIQGRPGLGNQP